MIRGAGFDLDNTLYDQDQHAFSFFGEASWLLAQETGVPAAQIQTCFLRKWRELTSRHPRFFDEVLATLGCRRPDLIVPLVDLYHHHRAALSLYPGARQVLDTLGGKMPLFLVTDGDAGMQRTKVAALGIEEDFGAIVYTSELGPGHQKPDVLPFQVAAERLGVSPGHCVYVGDNPNHDFAGARRAKMTTVRVFSGPFAGEAAATGCDADHAVGSLAELPALFFGR